jgi:coenzyme PQQ precursor peptide PqqA
MTWETPAVIEIRMDAELTAYLDDLDGGADASPAPTADRERA